MPILTVAAQDILDENTKVNVQPLLDGFAVKEKSQYSV